MAKIYLSRAHNLTLDSVADLRRLPVFLTEGGIDTWCTRIVVFKDKLKLGRLTNWAGGGINLIWPYVRFDLSEPNRSTFHQVADI